MVRHGRGNIDTVNRTFQLEKIINREPFRYVPITSHLVKTFPDSNDISLFRLKNEAISLKTLTRKCESSDYMG